MPRQYVVFNKDETIMQGVSNKEVIKKIIFAVEFAFFPMK